MARLKRTRRGYEEVAPVFCTHGHILKSNCLVGSQQCRCGVIHRSYFCKTCEETSYEPVMGTNCKGVDFDGR